jgi:predicted HNH restriction endonuclease
MTTCTVNWRSSGGRGEFEFVPANSLEERDIEVFFEPLSLVTPAEVKGVRAQGKPRLRKFEKNNRQKFHLPQLIMAIARLPEPAREDLHPTVVFPLENKSFVMDKMFFDVIEDDGLTVKLAPLKVTILHSSVEIDLQERFKAIATDLQNLDSIERDNPALAQVVRAHGELIMQAVNTTQIRKVADDYIRVQSEIFGMTNAGSAVVLEKYAKLPEVEIEAEITGKEGRMLTRIHSYKERDRQFSLLTKRHYKIARGGVLVCEACNLNPIQLYGPEGERCIEAHHKIPIE